MARLFRMRGVFWDSGFADPGNFILSHADEFKEVVNGARTHYFESVERRAVEGLYVRLLDIKIFELTGRDTAKLYAAREKAIKQQVERDKERIKWLAEEAAERERRTKEEDARIFADVRDKFRAGERVGIDDFLRAAKMLAVKMHPRTMHNAKKSVSYVARKDDTTALIWGTLKERQMSGIARAVHSVYNAYAIDDFLNGASNAVK